MTQAWSNEGYRVDHCVRIESLHEEIKKVNQRDLESEMADTDADQWKFAGMVLDKLFFYLNVLAILIIMIMTLGMMPNKFEVLKTVIAEFHK